MFWNYYNEYDLDLKNRVRNNDYISIICNMVSNMFEIEGMTPEYKNHLFKEVIFRGSALVKKSDNGKWIICSGNYSGVPDPDKIFPDEYIACKNTYQFHGIPDPEKQETVVYLIPERAPFDVIFRFSSQLSEIDTSLVNNIQFSRIAPMPVVNDDTTKTAVVEAIKGMIQGKLINPIKAKFLRINGQDELFPVINLSDGAYSEKIQYLSMYHEQTIARLCRLFGVNYNFISKQANITNNELDNCKDFTRLYPLILKQTLNEGLNKIGLTAEFTEPFKWIEQTYEEMMELEQESADDSNNSESDDSNNSESDNEEEKS